MKNANRQQQQQKAQPTAAQSELMSCSSRSKRQEARGWGAREVRLSITARTTTTTTTTMAPCLECSWSCSWRRRCVLYSQAALLWCLLCPLHPLPTLDPPPPLAGWALIFMNRNNLTVWGNMRVCCQYLCFQQVLYSLVVVAAFGCFCVAAACQMPLDTSVCLSSWLSPVSSLQCAL